MFGDVPLEHRRNRRFKNKDTEKLDEIKKYDEKLRSQGRKLLLGALASNQKAMEEKERRLKKLEEKRLKAEMKAIEEARQMREEQMAKIHPAKTQKVKFEYSDLGKAKLPEKVEKIKTSYVVMKGSKSDIQNMKQQMGVINYNIPGSFFRFSDQNEIPTDVEVAHIVTETDVDGFSPPPEALSPKDGETTEKVREAVNKSNMSMFSEHSSGS